MGRVNQLGLESKHKDYRPHNTSFDVRARLNVNDLIEKRKQEKEIDRKTNILIFSGATTLAIVILIILSF